MVDASIIKSLRQSVLFQNLPDEALNAIAAKAKTREFFPEETIVWQGKPSDSLYLITNGIVVVKKIISNENEHILAYLMPGNTFGEVGILENQPRSATVSAVSDVEVVVIRRKDFLDILQLYPSVAVELAKMLGRYLMEANRRISQGNRKAKLILLFGIVKGAGGTSVGNILSQILVEKTRKTTLFTEYPSPENLADELHISRRARIFHHPAGYDILVSQSEDNTPLPETARTTLLLDEVMKEYENIVICLPAIIDENITIMLDYANQIIILAPPVKELWSNVEDIRRQIRKHIRPEETMLFTIVNRNKREYQQIRIDEPYDFQIPFVHNFPSLRIAANNTHDKLPKLLAEVVETFVDRLERTNQIGVFIPTTIDVDLSIDTSPYVEQTLNFLAKRFGGATIQQVQGAWNSEKSGVVDETVYIVHTYVTHADMHEYLDEVIEYIKDLKIHLKQEAMALEVNRKLTLI